MGTPPADKNVFFQPFSKFQIEIEMAGEYLI